jgi:hypothetical protein
MYYSILPNLVKSALILTNKILFGTKSPDLPLKQNGWRFSFVDFQKQLRNAT